MQIKNMKKLISCFAITAAVAGCLCLAACGTEPAANTTDNPTPAANAAPAVGTDSAGFEETPIFEDIEAGGWLNVSAVYFQPVPMTDGSTIEGKDIHLEADISALENNFGFGVGDWVPYLTVEYKVTDSAGKVAASGTFMEMSASDGPHYGANIAMPGGQGTYTLEVTIKSPADNNFLLHTDAETGPGAKSFDDGVKWPLVVSESWDYVPLEY